MQWIKDFWDNPGALYILIRIIIIIALTIAVSAIVNRINKRFFRRQRLYRQFFHSLAGLIIYFCGLILCFSQFPSFNHGVTTLLTGSGIAALIIGLAAQETLGNAINGMSISFAKPFEVGDRIVIVGRGISGYVENITLRHTIIRTYNNSRYIIPNSVISQEVVENSDFLESKSSGYVDVTISYDSDMDHAILIIENAIKDHPDYTGDEHPKVYIRNLGIHGVELRASVWTKDINANFNVCSDIRLKLKSEFDKAGIAFAKCYHTDSVNQG